MAKLLLAIMLVAGSTMACRADAPVLPSRFTCAVVRTLYRHYQKQHYTIDQMKDYLRGNGLSEEKITGAEKCLK
jgi:hypothetical protein